MNIKELRQLIKLCREQGVESIRYEGIELHLGHAPMPKARRQPSAKQKEAIASGQPDIDTPDMLTEEQLLNWSVGQDQ